MELFFELSRRCNMRCSHCLRGDAQGLDMSQDVMYSALSKLGEHASSFGIGGGEPSLRTKVFDRFIQNISWSNLYLNIDAPIWIVSNGKRFLSQHDFALPYNHYSHEDPGYENIPEVEAIMKLSMYMDVSLAISTDQWHQDNSEIGPKSRFNHTEFLFSCTDSVRVVTHGPRGYNNLIHMGRQRGGKPLEIGAESYLCYVTINGDVYTTCDLSYKFMDTHKDTSLCIGNVLTDSAETILYNRTTLDLLLAHNAGKVEVSEDDISELLVLEEDYLNKITHEQIR